MELREAHATIVQAVDGGAGMDELEGELTRVEPLSREHRDALWLFAWAQVERRELRGWPRTRA